jgi:hypothetical protein
VLLTVWNLLPTRLESSLLKAKAAVNYNYNLWDKCIIRTESIKAIGVLLDPKGFFTVMSVTYLFNHSKFGSRTYVDLFCFYYWLFIIVIFYLRFELEYASPVWHNITTTDAKKLERVQRKFTAQYFSRFSPNVPYNYACALELLQLHTLQVRRHHLDALSFVHVLLGSKCCPPLIDGISLRVPSCNIRNFTQFYLAHKKLSFRWMCNSWKLSMRWYRYA